MLLLFWIVICDLYLFPFIVLLNPDFNSPKSFISFSFDKVTTRKYNFVSVILNSNSVGATIARLSPCAAYAVLSAEAIFWTS